MYEEVISKYRIGSVHKAVYENLTGNQMWSIIQSKFGQPSLQAAIAEARQACEDHATQSNLVPRCINWRICEAASRRVIVTLAQAGVQANCWSRSALERHDERAGIAYADLCNQVLDLSKCVPVAVDDWQVFDPGPLFSVAERAQDQQANLSTLVTPPRE
jgi:hypothetical protein